MAELDDNWKAGHELASHLIDGFRQGYPAVRHLFAIGDTPFGPDEAFGWLFFQGWYVERRAPSLLSQSESASAPAVVESYLRGFGDTLYFELTGGHDPLSERDKTVLKAFDETRANLDSMLGQLTMPREGDLQAAYAVRMYCLALFIVCSTDVAESLLPNPDATERDERSMEFLHFVDSLLEPLQRRIESAASAVAPGRENSGGLESSGWPRLGEEDLSQLTLEERQLVRDLEQRGIDGESLATQDIIINCQNKLQFAKTFRVLHADKQKTLSALATTTSPFRPEVTRAAATAYERIIDYKLWLLSSHFEAKWGEPITRWTTGPGWMALVIFLLAVTLLAAL